MSNKLRQFSHTDSWALHISIRYIDLAQEARIIPVENDYRVHKKDIISFVLQKEIRKSFIAEIRPKQRAEKVIHSEEKSVCKGTEVLNSTAYPGNCK